MVRMSPMEDGNADKILGPLEHEVMKAVWSAGAALSVRDVLDRLNDGRSQALAYTTVMTVMSRLAEKGHLRRQQAGRGYVYEAVVENAAGLAVRSVIRDFGDATAASFVDQARSDPKILKRLERLLNES
jgi:predicted transcriptional regulator